MIKLLSKEKREKLEALTRSIVDGMPHEAENVLWAKLLEKYGDKAKAGKWVYDKVKALVEENKSGSLLTAGVESTLAIAGDLGNESSPRRESVD